MGPTRVVADGVNPSSRATSNRAADNIRMARHRRGRAGQQSHGLQLSPPDCLWDEPTQGY